MGVAATTFQALPGPGRASISTSVASIVRAVRGVKAPTLALVFCSGETATGLGAVAQGVLEALGSEAPPLVLGSGLGVITEEGEHEGTNGVSGLILSGTTPRIHQAQGAQLEAEDLKKLWSFTSPRPRPVLTLLRAETVAPLQLWAARDHIKNPLLFGAGTHGAPGLLVARGGDLCEVSGVAIELQGLSSLTRTAHSFHLLSPLKRITRCEGSMVLELDGAPALTVLEELGNRLGGRPLLLTIVAHKKPSGEAAPDMLVRGIHGIDPDRKGLLISEEVVEGAYMTFGVRDAHAARTDFESLCRGLDRDLAGAVPRFGVYFNCSGRGLGLHKSPHVDSRVLRERFPRVPFVGFQSAFEIAPYCEAPALQLYTGVLTLFSSPS